MKMLFLVLLIISVGGTLSEEEADVPEATGIYKECENLIRGGKRMKYDHVPDSEELKEICPNEIQYHDCLTQKMEKDETESEFMITFEKKNYEFFKEICDEDSDLHKGYISSVACYTTMEDKAKTCFAHAKDVYKANHLLINHEEPEDVDSDWIEIDAMCMVMSVTVACLSKNVMDACDEVAYSTMMELVSKSQILYQYCSPTVKNVLKTSILSSLDVDEPTRNAYRDLFDIIKK